MDYICQQYIKQIRLLLPTLTKNEKNYLKHLYLDLKEYCEEKEISSLEELYQSYGNPAEFVQAYLSDINKEYFHHCFTRRKIKKILLTCCIIIFIALATTFMSELYFLHDIQSQINTITQTN